MICRLFTSLRTCYRMAERSRDRSPSAEWKRALMSNHARYSLPLQSITHMDLWVMVSVFRSNSTIWSFLRTGYSVVLLQWFQSITTFPSFNDDVPTQERKPPSLSTMSLDSKSWSVLHAFYQSLTDGLTVPTWKNCRSGRRLPDFWNPYLCNRLMDFFPFEVLWNCLGL